MKKIVALIFLVAAGDLFAAEVSGIYTDSSTKDVGEVLKINTLKGLKVRGWIDTYYVYDFDNPAQTPGTGGAAPTGTTAAGNIEGRTFDIHSNAFTLSLAEVELEKVPDRGEVGFKFDMAYGDTQDIIDETIRAASGGGTISFFDKTFQHASLSYLANVGNGIRFDLGKFVTHIGGETIESIKNNNYSHTYFYTFAIPFQDTGLRMNYPLSDTFYTEFYLVNGWNVTIDDNKWKTFGLSGGWTPRPELSAYLNYFGGPEGAGNDFNDWRHLLDAQVFVTPMQKLNLLFNADLGVEQNAAVGGAAVGNAVWYGLTGTSRYALGDHFEPALRIEWYRDQDGFTTGTVQHVVVGTLTLNTKLGSPKAASHILVRPEFRVDHSTATFFNVGADKNNVTAGVGSVFYF